MRKVKHEYFCNSEYPIKSIAFKIKLNGLNYGQHDMVASPYDKFRTLRSLVLTKHQLIHEVLRIQKQIIINS